MTKLAAKGFPGNRAAVIIAGFGVFLFGGIVSAQPGIEAYDRGDLQGVREYLSAASTETAETLFLRAALMADADAAVELYRKMVLTYPESPLSPRAMDRIRQYFYAQGKYDKAAEFEKTLKGYKPPSMQLESDPISAGAAATKPIVKSDTVAAIEKPAGQTSPTPSPAPVQREVAGYCLQVGAFSQAANANKLKLALQKAGYKIEIIVPGSNSTRLHTVRVMGFANEVDARAAADDLRRKYNLNPILVPILKAP